MKIKYDETNDVLNICFSGSSGMQTPGCLKTPFVMIAKVNGATAPVSFSGFEVMFFPLDETLRQ